MKRVKSSKNRRSAFKLGPNEQRREEESETSLRNSNLECSKFSSELGKYEEESE